MKGSTDSSIPSTLRQNVLGYKIESKKKRRNAPRKQRKLNPREKQRVKKIARDNAKLLRRMEQIHKRQWIIPKSDPNGIRNDNGAPGHMYRASGGKDGRRNNIHRSLTTLSHHKVPHTVELCSSLFPQPMLAVPFD